MTTDEIGWTDVFEEFRRKVEPLFGKLEFLAEQAPDVYAHMVLSHGFMEYASIRGVFDDVKKRIHSKKGSYDPKNQVHESLFWQYVKTQYTEWASQNNIPTELVEEGWKQFLKD